MSGPDDKTETPLGFEQRIAQLEAYLAELERGELPLEEAIRKYESAVGELRRCYALVADAEAKVEALLTMPDGSQRTEPLELGEDDDEDGA